MPSEILDRLRSLPDRPPLAAWVGDSFFETDRTIAGKYDIVAYTDSFFVKQHQSMAFTSRCLYLPHAANTRLGEPNATARAPRLVFVANPTPHRVNLLSRVQMPIDLYGPGWQPFPRATHDIHRGQLDVLTLSAAYRSHIGVLNIRHETNTVHGQINAASTRICSERRWSATISRILRTTSRKAARSLCIVTLMSLRISTGG